MVSHNDAHTALVRDIELEAPKHACRAFKQNTGQGWVGQVVSNRQGVMVLENPRPLHAGLCAGSSDLIGWTTIEITPDMVGRKVAVFTAFEAKTGTGREEPDQIRFRQAVLMQGGIAFVLRSASAIRAAIDAFKAGALA